MRIRIDGDLLHHHSLARVNQQVARGLAHRGHEVIVRQKNDQDQLDRRHLPDIDLFYDMLEREGEADVIFRHAYPPDFSPVENGKVVYQQFWEFGSYPRDWKYAWARQAEHVVCGSGYLKQMMEADGIPVPSTLIHPGVNDEFLQDVEPLDLGLDPNRLTLLFVGGTVTRKGIDILLDAVDAAFTENDPVQLVVKDHPFYGSDISGRIEQMKIPVKYIRSYYSPEEVVRLYAACDVFVFPSRGEGFGFPLVEAMAQGLTIVTPDHTGLADFGRFPDMHIIPSSVSELGAEQLAGMSCIHIPHVFEPNRDALVEILRKVEAPKDRHRYRGVLPTWEAACDAYTKVFEEVHGNGRAPVYKQRLSGGRKVGLVPSLMHEHKAQEAVTVDPESPGLWVGLGQEHAMKGEFDKAIDCVTKAMELDPKARVNYLMLRGRTNLDVHRRTNSQKYLIRGVNDLLEAAEIDKGVPLRYALKGVRIPTDALRRKVDTAIKARKTVSAVMICRNEEDNLPRSLGSIRPFVDEVVVVDTGSTDRSVEIAKNYADIVVSRPDFFSEELGTLASFADARNASIDLATSDYIFWIDADDEITPSAGFMIRKLTQEDMGAASFPVHCPQAGLFGERSENRVRHYRFFKNLPSIRFVGEIHEQVAPAIIAAGIIPVAVDTAIMHHGYLDIEKLEGKYVRNLTLLEGTDDEGDWAGFNLMTTWLLKGDPDKAIEFGEARIATLKLNQAHAGKYLSTLAGAYLAKKEFPRAIELSLLGIENNINTVEHFFNLAGIRVIEAEELEGEEKQAKLAEAEDLYLKALEAPLFCRGGAVDIETGSIKSLIALGGVRSLRGDFVGASDAFLKALSYKNHPFARHQLVQCYEKLEDKRACARHAKLLNEQLDGEFEEYTLAAQALMEKGKFEEGSKAFKSILDRGPAEPGANLNYGVSLMVLGKYEEAMEYLLRSIGLGPTPQGYYQLARCLRELGRYEQAVVACDIVAAMNPTSGDLHYEMAANCCELGLHRLAIKGIEIASIAGYNPPEAMLVAGRSKMHLGDVDGSLEMVRRARDISHAAGMKAPEIYDALIM